MKNIIKLSVIIMAAFAIAACNNTNKAASRDAAKDTTKQAATPSTAVIAKPGIDPKATEAVNGLVHDYLQVKNALAKDNIGDAAAAGQALASAFDKFDQSRLTTEQKKSYNDIADDAKEMATHIGMSTSKLPHQREHFDMLSKDMYDLVKLTGAGQPLFVDHCPMYNNKKGAIWLSEMKAIKNPYMGSAMPTCGVIKEELK